MSAAEVTQSSIDEERRAIFLFGMVDEGMAQLAIPAIVEFSKEAEVPITVHVMSDGGQFAQGLAIYDALRACGCPIVTVAHGDVLSTAVVIYLAGDVRIAHRHTSFMLHRPYSSVTNSTANGFRDVGTYLAAQEARLEGILADAGCPLAFGPFGELTADRWVHGGSDALDAGLSTRLVPGSPRQNLAS